MIPAGHRPPKRGRGTFPVRTIPLCAALLLAGITLLCTGGCGGGGDHPAAHAPDLLRIGSPMQVRQANPLADYSYGIFAMLATHETLVRFDPAMRPLPQLAQSWQASSDGRQWRFRLRTDAHWHDGRPVRPADVKFTFDYLAAHNGPSAWMKNLIQDIRVDGSQITFDLAKPYSRFLINCGFIVRILPQHIWQDVSDPFKPGDAAVTMGCGPFVFQRFDPRTGRLQFTRNNGYHGPAPAVTGLDFFLNRTFDALALSLQRGDMDLFYKYASGFPATHMPALTRAPSLRLPAADAMGIPAALGFNLDRQPVASAAFRRAVTEAMDYKRIAASLLGGSGRIPDAGFIPPAFADRLVCPALQCAPEKSRRRLDAAGFSDTDGDGVRNLPGGGNVVLTLLARADLAGVDALLPIISHSLKQVGISLAIQRADLSTWIERVHQKRFDLVLFRTTPWGMVMDAGCADGYFDSRRKGGGTLANVTDPAFHLLVDRLLETTDPSVQLRLRQDMQRYYAEHLPAVALGWAVNTYPVQESWQGLTINQIEGGLVNRQTFSSLHRRPSGR